MSARSLRFPRNRAFERGFEIAFGIDKEIRETTTCRFSEPFLNLDAAARAAELDFARFKRPSPLFEKHNLPSPHVDNALLDTVTTGASVPVAISTSAYHIGPQRVVRG